jgi:hypothetical protein
VRARTDRQEERPSDPAPGAAAGSAFGADGRRILTWGSDRTVRLWDTDTQDSIGQPMQHENAVDGALLMDDQRRVMSWGADGTVR